MGGLSKPFVLFMLCLLGYGTFVLTGWLILVILRRIAPGLYNRYTKREMTLLAAALAIIVMWGLWFLADWLSAR